MQNIANILFIVAGVLWAIELLPQLIKTIRTKRVRDISLFFLSLCFTAYLIFIVGCFLIKNWFLFFSHLVPFININILLYLVLKYKEKTQHFPPDNMCQAAYIMKNLKPCPFCKSINVKIHRNFDYVYCEDCGARGTYFDGHPKDAINAWNERYNNKDKNEKDNIQNK